MHGEESDSLSPPPLRNINDSLSPVNKSSKWFKVVYNNNKVEECNQTKLTDILNICGKTCNNYTTLGFPYNKLQEKNIKNIIVV